MYRPEPQEGFPASEAAAYEAGVQSQIDELRNRDVDEHFRRKAEEDDCTPESHEAFDPFSELGDREAAETAEVASWDEYAGWDSDVESGMYDDDPSPYG